jgi:nucleotide-binding universal stress UspA family protein
MTKATPPLDSDLEDFAQQIADQVESFLLALRAISRGEAPGSTAVSLLLLEVSQVLLAGGRLGVHSDFMPADEYEPDAGPDPDLDAMRLRLAHLLDPVETYTYNFDPYAPEIVEAQLSDDLTAVATDLANGLRHYRTGNVAEALWWWQYSYVADWGNLASAALRALQSVVAHDRLDLEFEIETEQIAAAEAVLDTGEPVG